MKAIVAAFNQEKALVGAFSVITNLRMDLRFKLYYTGPARYLNLGRNEDCYTPLYRALHTLTMWFIFINSRRGSNILTFSHLYMFMVRYYPAEEKWHTFRNHSKDTRTIFAMETGDFRDGRMIFCARREINSLCNSPSSWRCCVGSKQSGLWTKYRSHGGLAASAETRRSPKHRAGKTCRDGKFAFFQEPHFYSHSSIITSPTT